MAPRVACRANRLRHIEGDPPVRADRRRAAVHLPNVGHLAVRKPGPGLAGRQRPAGWVPEPADRPRALRSLAARPTWRRPLSCNESSLALLLKQCDRFFVTTATRIGERGRALSLASSAGAEFGSGRPQRAARPRAARPAQDGVSPGPRIGFFSTMARGKRFDVVLEAFDRIARELPLARLADHG